MFPLTAAMLLVGAEPAVLHDIDVNSLPAVFAATCLDGGAQIPAASLTKIDFHDLPSRLRDDLGRPNSAQVWRVNTSGRAYLYVLSYAPDAGVNPKICGLASDQMNMKSASDLLDVRLAGSIYPGKRVATQWLQPEDGYSATATTAGDFRVVQVNWLSDRERAEVLKDMSPVSR